MFITMAVVLFQSGRDSRKYRVEECKLLLSISIEKMRGENVLTLAAHNILEHMHSSSNHSKIAMK